MTLLLLFMFLVKMVSESFGFCLRIWVVYGFEWELSGFGELGFV